MSDGSTDRNGRAGGPLRRPDPADRVRAQPGLRAAIKAAAWAASDADLLGFDADGTCDPAFFAELCATPRPAPVWTSSSASGLNEGSRRCRGCAGSATAFRLAAAGGLSQEASDTASGMRAVRRSCLLRPLPLPDGLHFTPAMSAWVLPDDDLTLAEVAMLYHERARRAEAVGGPGRAGSSG